MAGCNCIKISELTNQELPKLKAVRDSLVAIYDDFKPPYEKIKTDLKAFFDADCFRIYEIGGSYGYTTGKGKQAKALETNIDEHGKNLPDEISRLIDDLDAAVTSLETKIGNLKADDDAYHAAEEAARIAAEEAAAKEAAKKPQFSPPPYSRGW